MTPTPILPPDSSYLIDASGYTGTAEQVFTPVDAYEVCGVMRQANVELQPVTISGAGTGVTGGRVPQGGWVLSLEKLTTVDIGSGFATCGAGVLLRDLLTAATPSRQYYAPDPTEWGASLGGTVATNASGSRSFMYGDTRRHVRALQVILASGEKIRLRRGEKPPIELPEIPGPKTTKNTAGYFLRPGMDYIDLFIGSEGTLGVVVEAEVVLMRMPKELFTGVVFYTTDDAALAAVEEWHDVRGLRMLEYLDAASLDLLRPRYSEIPKSARAAILIEQEVNDGEDAEDAWLIRLGKSKALDTSWFATSAADREKFRKFRHSVPEAVNDLIRRKGLTKMGSDFAVPIKRNGDMLKIYREALDREFPGQYVIFGHIGDAHLHANILPANQEEWVRAKALMMDFARQAVAMGGTVSAEHGLGKRKKDLLPLMFSEHEIALMRSVKARLDPKNLLGRGTLFD